MSPDPLVTQQKARRRRRRWRRLSWAARIAALAIGVIWPLTALYGLTLVVAQEAFRFSFYGGALTFQFNSTTSETAGFYWVENPGRNFWWWPALERWYTLPGGGGGICITNVIIPLWTIALTLAAFALFARRRSRPPLPGHCRTCGYDLQATAPEAPCPECGRAGTRTA